MDELLTRIADDLIGRLDGPLHFRLILQPVMASIFAVLDGLKDARNAARPYISAMISDPTDRKQLMRDGWKRVGKVFVLAVVLDIIYQLIVLHFVYPGEVLIAAFLLAIVPYLLLRGIVTRVARWIHRR